MDETTRESNNPWLKEISATQSTIIPANEDSNVAEIGTIIIFVVSAILLITLLFVIAIFIDCRHQKVQQKFKPKIRRKTLRLKMPIARIPRPIQEEEDTIVDKMQEEPTSSHVVISIT